MKAFLLVQNYKDEIVSTHRTRKCADTANKALVGTFATVVEVNFVSPRQEKALKALAVAPRR